jgi:hypothetical protein
MTHLDYPRCNENREARGITRNGYMVNEDASGYGSWYARRE